MRICGYKYCEKDISHKRKQVKYCYWWHMKKQGIINRKEDFIARMKIDTYYMSLKTPTRITPQAGRYQDLLIYSTTVMSNFD